jgi:hypothetical protein
VYGDELGDALHMSKLELRTRVMSLRSAAVAAPFLLLTYGVLRLIDGRDGDQGSGFWWNTGHLAFLLGMLVFAALAVGLRSLAPDRVADVATVTVLVGTVAFVWVILGDLFPRFDDAVPVPDLVMSGPILFQVGLLALLVRLVVRRLLPVWSPVLVLLGFVPIAVNLDLLPLGALLILAGLSPLAVRRQH